MGRKETQGIHPLGLTAFSGEPDRHPLVRRLLASAGISLKKRLGQHFITDRNLLRRIAELMIPAPGFSAVEVGAGAGTLTLELSRVARRVIAVEIDERLKTVVEQMPLSEGGNVSWIWGDVLEIDFEKIISGTGGREETRWILCGNLPYYLTSELLYKVLIPRTSFSRLAFLVQKEVADRMAASPGSRDFGRLSLWCSYRGTVKILRRVPRQVFSPPPMVDSCLVALDFHRSFPLDPSEEETLDEISRHAFAQRRKTIANALKGMFGDKQVLLNVLEEAGIRPDSRPEQVPLEAYVQLAGLSSRLPLSTPRE